MPLAAGTRLGPYEIVAVIGAGGMGEVYRARDTRLERTVAVKVLRAHLSSNPEFKLRFDREARAISSLSHPNICALFDVGHQDGIDFLVMEFLEGQTLADRLRRGPIPASELLRIGTNIADGLTKAHRSGVIHRDLKPANVMLTATGAKLLDFGLAKAAAAGASASAELPAFTAANTQSEPSSSPITQQGTVVGTYQYMAPEQIEGREADTRSDIFAFGSVLYEMASGRRAFEGKSQLSVASAILERDPESLHSIQPLTPPALEHVVQTCLAKDPEDRYQTAHDIAVELKWIGQAGVVSTTSSRPNRRERWAWMFAIASIIVLIALLFWTSLRPEKSGDVLQLSLARPDGAPFSRFGGLALSPDGKFAVFTGEGESNQVSLWLRRMDGTRIDPIPLTQGGGQPFWSPDSRSIGFFADGKLKRIDLGGGPPQVLCDAPAIGGTWSRDGVILFGSDGPIQRVSSAGGAPTAATKLDPEEEGHRWPWFLPDGKHFLFLGDANRTEDHTLKVGSLEGGVKTLFHHAITNAIYVAPGYLLYIRDGALVAHAFDMKSLSLVGGGKVIGPDIAPSHQDHRFEFSASETGLLAYRSTPPEVEVTWVDHAGKRLGSAGEQGRLGQMVVSPDGKQLIVMRLDLSGRVSNYWIRDLARGVSSRITFHPGDDHGAVWSPDNTQFVYASSRQGGDGLYQAPIANPTREELLYKQPSGQMFPTSWSADGQAILFNYFGGNADVWIFRFTDRKAEPLLQSKFSEYDAVFSPDQHWIAYASDESGALQIYVQSFPSGSKRIQISADHGDSPRWSSDGRELYYLGPGNKVISMPVQSKGGDLIVGNQKDLFPVGIYDFVPHPDGRRFLMQQPRSDPFLAPITITLGWQQALENRSGSR